MARLLGAVVLTVVVDGCRSGDGILQRPNTRETLKCDTPRYNGSGWRGCVAEVTSMAVGQAWAERGLRVWWSFCCGVR